MLILQSKQVFTRALCEIFVFSLKFRMAEGQSLSGEGRMRVRIERENSLKTPARHFLRKPQGHVLDSGWTSHSWQWEVQRKWVVMNVCRTWWLWNNRRQVESVATGEPAGIKCLFFRIYRNKGPHCVPTPFLTPILPFLGFCPWSFGPQKSPFGKLGWRYG